MKKLIPLLFLLTLFVPQSFIHANESDHYMFLSAKVSAKIDDEFHRIKSFDGKKLTLTGTKKQTRANGSNPCTHIASVAVSKVYADLEDLDYGFSSREMAYKSADAISDMVNMQSAFALEVSDVGVARQGAIASGSSEDSDAVESFNNDIAKLETQSLELDNMFMERASGDVEDSEDTKMVDSVYGTFSVTPENDIENCYAVIVFSFDDDSARMRLKGVRTKITRAVPVGDLRAGVKKKVNFINTFNTRLARNPQFDVYLYTGNGMPIATSLSPGLKKLTVSQYEKFRKMQIERAKLQSNT